MFPLLLFLVVFGMGRFFWIMNFDMKVRRQARTLDYHLKQDPNFDDEYGDEYYIRKRLTPSKFIAYFKIWRWTYGSISADPELWREATKIQELKDKQSEANDQAAKDCFNERIDIWLKGRISEKA